VIDRESDFHFEIGFSSGENSGTFGIRLKSVDINVFEFKIDLSGGLAATEWPGSGGNRSFKLAQGFDPLADHQLSIDIEAETVRLAVDNGEIETLANLPTQPSAIALFSSYARVEFGPIDLTSGFEELFMVGDLVKRGWDHYSNRGSLIMENGLLRLEGSGSNTAVITRNVPGGDYELCINLRLVDAGGPESHLTFGCGNMFTLPGTREPVLDADGQRFPLPEEYAPHEFSQFRISRNGDRVNLFLEAVHICSGTATDGEFVRITAQDCNAELDMVRFTRL
jgi:hypothetical protein